MKSRGKAVLWALWPALLLLPLLLWLGRNYADQLAYEQRIRTQRILELDADAVQRSIEQIKGKLESLAVFVADQTAGGKAVDAGRFNTFAAGLHASSTWIRAFQIVSDGVIVHVYPRQGNEAALGYNLLADLRPGFGGDVARAMETGRPTITGPVALLQGGQGIVLRKLLARTPGTPALLVGVVLNINPLLAESGVGGENDRDIRLAIRREGGAVFFGPPSVFDLQPVTRRLALPDGAWEMGACPTQGWPAFVSRPVLLFHLAGATIISLLCVLVFVLAHSRANLRVTVREQTEALRRELAAREQTQEQLEQNYALLHAVTEGISDSVFVKDRHGRYQMINSAGARFLGRMTEAIIGRDDTEWFSADTAPAIMDGDRKVIESGQVLTLEERGTIAGITRIYQSTKAPWRDPHGAIIGVVGVARDITDRNRMEEALRESESQLSSILNNISDVIFAIAVEPDDGFRFISVNRRFLDATGLAESQIVGARVRDIVPKPAQALVFQHYHEAIRSGRPTRWEEVSEYPTGKKIGHVTVVPVFDAHGVCTQLVGMVHDVTERHQAEEQIRRLNEDLRRHAEALEQRVAERTRELAKTTAFLDAIVDHTPNPVFYKDSDLRYAGCNLAYEEAFGVKRADLVGKTILELDYLPEAMRRSYQEEQARLLAEGGSLRREAPYRFADGRIHQTLFSVSAFRRADELHGGLVGVLVDITPLKESEAALAEAKERAEAADRVKSAFLATMSHELRTPLNSIIGFTGLMLQGLTGPLNAEQTKQLRMVKGSSNHLLDLINDVLDISKIEAGQIEIACAPFDLCETIHKVIRTVAPMAEGKQLPLVVEVAPDAGQITSDRRRVEQVLLNLLSNAIKFTERGKVRLACRRNGEAMVIRVTDTGMGIKPENLDRLFQPFRQLDTGLTRQHEGTGLGLAICKRLVERLGGAITLESEWGAGSTFQFTLPIHPERNL
jgi:PAS domain S-box-containing protein